MSLKKVIVSGAAALALMGTAALAANIQVEKDGTGDYLLTPVYYAVANWKTELKVVNTNTSEAVVAKVVVRESKESKEIMDFAIYLTPGDVWTGTLYDDNGIIKLKSTDDSMIIGGKIASPSSPIVIGVHPRREGPEGGKYHHENWHGYVEIVGLAAYDAHWLVKQNKSDADDNWQKCTPVDKLTFYKAVVKQGQKGLQLVDTNASDVANSDLLGKATIFAEDSNPSGRRYMSINMLALGNFSEGPVIKKDVLGVDTTPDNMSTKTGLALISQYEQAIGKSKVFVMYEGDGNTVYPIRTHFTVPTKKYRYYLDVNGFTGLTSTGEYTSSVNDDPYGEGSQNYKADTLSEYYYTLNNKGADITARDNSEHCNKCGKTTEVSGTKGENCDILIHEEVHFFEYTNTNPANLYDSSNPYKDLMFKSGGFVTFDLSNHNYKTTPKTQINGLPVVPSTFYAKDVQGLYLNNWLYNQYEETTVSTPSNID